MLFMFAHVLIYTNLDTIKYRTNDREIINNKNTYIIL